MSENQSPIVWNKDDPLHSEIMAAGKRAFIERNLALLERDVEEALNVIPQPFRLLYSLHWAFSKWLVRRRLSEP